MTDAFRTAVTFSGLLVLLVMALGVNVSLRRLRMRVFLGDGGDKTLARMIRLHGNAAEHVPLLILMLLALGLLGAPQDLTLLAGIACLAARIAHLAGNLMKVRGVSIAGSVLTYTLEAVLPIGAMALASSPPA